jgi:hypothetical protein
MSFHPAHIYGPMTIATKTTKTGSVFVS